MILIPDEYFETESCVYKLYYGDKYLIVKGKTLAGSIFFIEKGYASVISSGGGKQRTHDIQKEWEDKNKFYFKFYKHIYDNPKLQFRIEVLLETNNAYHLLKREQQELTKSIRDKKCLNSNLTSYIPKFNTKTNMYGWITKKQVASFRRFLTLN
jgi:hypothetical protein